MRPTDPPSYGDKPPTLLDKVVSNLVSTVKEWASQFSTMDNKNELYKGVSQGDRQAEAKNTKRDAGSKIHQMSKAEVSPYVTIAVGKQTSEGSPISSFGSVTLTKGGVYFAGGADVSVSGPSVLEGLPVSASISAGVVIGPSSGLPGYSEGGGGGSFIGVEHSRGLNVDSKGVSPGSTQSFGIVATIVPAWYSVNTGYTLPPVPLK